MDSGLLRAGLGAEERVGAVGGERRIALSQRLVRRHQRRRRIDDQAKADLGQDGRPAGQPGLVRIAASGSAQGSDIDRKWRATTISRHLWAGIGE